MERDVRIIEIILVFLIVVPTIVMFKVIESRDIMSLFRWQKKDRISRVVLWLTLPIGVGILTYIWYLYIEGLYKRMSELGLNQSCGIEPWVLGGQGFWLILLVLIIGLLVWRFILLLRNEEVRGQFKSWNNILWFLLSLVVVICLGKIYFTLITDTQVFLEMYIRYVSCK